MTKVTTSNSYSDGIFNPLSFKNTPLVVGQICNNFKKNRAFYDKSMELGTCLVDSNTK